MPRMQANRFNTSTAVLWASAFLIAAMVIVQAGRLPVNSAHAEMTTTRGSYTLLTTSSGRGGERPHELLYIIDAREQVLLVYEVEDARRNIMHLRESGSVENLFLQARR